MNQKLAQLLKRLDASRAELAAHTAHYREANDARAEALDEPRVGFLRGRTVDALGFPLPRKAGAK